MSEVTIVCCYNNEEQYNNFVNSLKAQNYPFEIIGLDNRGNKNFTSCSSAYNSVKDKIKTKYVIYSHQDIIFTESDAIAKAVSYLDRIAPDDIIGVAGVKFSIKALYSNMKHIDKETGELIYPGNDRIDGDMMECDTVDECFFGGYTQHFRQYPFDEVICNNWHLYAVEACLRTRSKILGGGGHNVYVCDIPLMHLSSGTLNRTFYRECYKLCRKYHKYFPLISASTGRYRTDWPHAFGCLIWNMIFPAKTARDVIVNLLKSIGIFKPAKALKKKILG